MKVAGWKKIAVPVSVDKVGVFFRKLEPSDDDELDNHVSNVMSIVCLSVCLYCFMCDCAYVFHLPVSVCVFMYLLCMSVCPTKKKG